MSSLKHETMYFDWAAHSLIPYFIHFSISISKYFEIRQLIHIPFKSFENFLWIFSTHFIAPPNLHLLVHNFILTDLQIWNTNYFTNKDKKSRDEMMEKNSKKKQIFYTPKEGFRRTEMNCLFLPILHNGAILQFKLEDYFSVESSKKSFLK